MTGTSRYEQLVRERSASCQPQHLCPLFISSDQDPKHLRTETSTSASLWHASVARSKLKWSTPGHNLKHPALISTCDDVPHGPEAASQLPEQHDPEGMQTFRHHSGTGKSLCCLENIFLDVMTTATRGSKVIRSPQVQATPSFTLVRSWPQGALGWQSTALHPWWYKEETVLQPQGYAWWEQPQQDQKDGKCFGSHTAATTPMTRKARHKSQDQRETGPQEPLRNKLQTLKYTCKIKGREILF